MAHLATASVCGRKRWRQAQASMARGAIAAGAFACVSAVGAAPGPLPFTDGAPTTLALSASPPTPRPALSLRVGSRAQLIYEPRLWRPQELPANAVLEGDGAAHLSLQLKASRRIGPRDLLRLELSGGGVMQFKPRRRGLMLRYQSQF